MQTYSVIDLLRNTTVVKEYNSIKKEIAKGYDFLEDFKRTKLISLLKHSAKHPFYKDLIQGFDEQTINADPFKVLNSLPLVSKGQIDSYKNWYTEIDTDQTYESRFTGGSTGTPFKYYLSKYSISRITAFNYFLWHQFLGYNIGDRILTIGGDSLGQIPNMKTKLYNFLQRKYFIPGDIISENVLREGLKLIFEEKYDVIYAYASSLEYFVDEAIKRNIKFKGNLKGVITVSEMLTDNTRNKFSDFFKCNVLNCYGARDGGVMGGEFKKLDNGFYHNFYDCNVESIVVDPQLGKSELILTNLGNYSFPFIRYRVGDIGVIEKYSPDFRLPLYKITNLEGRTRDLVYTRDKKGVVHGSAFNAILKASSGIDRYQIVQGGDFNLEIRIKSIRPDDVSEELITNLVKSLVNDPSIEVKLSLNHEFIQSKNQKHKIIVSHVN